MRRNHLMGFAFALAAATSAQAASAQTAQPPQQHDGRGHQQGDRADRRGPGQRLFQGITLTAQQQEQVRAIMAEGRPARGEQGQRPARGQADGQRGERRQLTEQERQQFEARRAEMQQRRAQSFQRIRGILTADQRAQFDRNVAQMEAQRGQRGERGARGQKSQRQGGASRS